ncbi:LTA synthase family protein [Nitrosococcus watsonii]|nr:LTA synthase family protein [Nitrosococcus watsonii]
MTKRIIAPLAMPLLLVLFSLGRAWLSEQGSLAAAGCAGCLVVPTIQHDLALLGVFLLATALWLGLPRYIRWLAWLIQGGLLLIIVADLVTLAAFNMRLSWRDVLKFGGEWEAVQGYLGTKATAITGLLWLIGVGILLSSWAAHLMAAQRLGQSGLRGIIIAAAICFSLYALPTTIHHPLPWLYRNVVEINLPSGVDRAYSEAYRSQVLAAHSPPPLHCIQGRALRRNVVIVIIESWSWYHSQDRLGVMNATPQLDRFARRGTLWTRFFSNGFTTDHGLIALLGGVAPLPPVNRYHSLEGYTGFEELPDSLPRRLAADGYESYFFTTGDLGFMAKGKWLKRLGFHKVEGDNHPFYQEAQRFSFNGAHDGWLYNRFLQWLVQEAPPKRPYLAVLETVTTHPPFVDPATGRQDELTAFRFADAQVARFIDHLDKRGFFEEGLVILTSDQRALSPLRTAETKAFGPAAPALLPLVVLGGSFDSGKQVTTAAQMADMPASLDYLLTDGACQEERRGNLFTQPPQSPRCILRPQGNQRDIVDAYCGDQHAQIQLEGDKTRILRGTLPHGKALIEQINIQRIGAGARKVEFTHIL